MPRHAGIIGHRTNLREPVDVTAVDGIPVTTVARTLLDLGAVVPLELVERATQDAIIRQLVSAVELICVLERVGTRGRRGTAALRATVRAGTAPKGIESHLELDLLRLIEACSVPTPVLQHQIVVDDGRRFRLDMAWPELRVAVEADGRLWHSTRQEFEQGMSRIRAITAAGWDHYRYGWSDVHQRTGAVRAAITAVITAAVASRQAGSGRSLSHMPPLQRHM
ncbi:MAG: hypothetical protein ACR2G7_14070 [Acidimicrobiales bacterium]